MKNIPTPAPSVGDLYCHRLLNHDGLMTPVLLAEFGQLRAAQRAARYDGGVYLRQSSIKRIPGDETVLDAQLEISVAALPDGFVQELEGSGILFGQLLKDHGIAVRVSGRHIYSVQGVGGAMTRWGRRLTILRASDAMRVCDVDELLVPGDELLRLRRTTGQT